MILDLILQSHKTIKTHGRPYFFQSDELALGDDALPWSCGFASRVGVKGSAFNFRLFQNQSQVLLVIMCSCNSSNSAPCSCSCFPKVNGKSPGFCWCRCIKQWEATGREKPELVSVVEGVLTTMREKFPMDLHVLKLEADSMKHPRGDLQRNGSS